MTRSIIFVVLIALASGCGKPEPPSTNVENAAVVDDDAFNALFEQARAHYHEGDTDSAVDLLTESLADPLFVSNQPTIFRALIELLLLENRVIDAQTNFLAMLHACPDVAAQTFSMIPTHLKRQPDAAGYLSWCEQMIGAELPAGIAESAYGYYVDAYVQLGAVDKLDALAQESFDRFGGGGAVRVLTRPIGDLIDKQEYVAIQSALTVLSTTGDKAALDFVAVTEITLAAAQGQWENVVSMYKEKGADLPDNATRQALRTVSSRAMAAERADVVDQLCEYVLAAMPDAQATRSQAISLYLDVAKTSGNFDRVVTRLKALRDAGAGDNLNQKVSGVFYEVMNKASAASRKTMLQMVKAMHDEAPDGGRSHMEALLMDGAVLTSDYALALKVLNDGFRADDVEWVAMARNKLGAHLAIEEGRVDDAVGLFRDFMKHVETWTDSTVDPSTGIAHTREMCLGFNAKRIGNIYRDAARADDAAKAYAEARDYFNAAMAAAKEGSKEAAYIKEQMAELPAMEPAPSL